MNASRHLAPELLFGYEHQLLTPEEVTAVHAHIADCKECRVELAASLDAAAMARDFQAALAPARSPRFPRWIVYAAAAAIAAIIFGITFAHGDRQVESALRAGRIAVPPFVQELNPPPEVLMGAADSGHNELLSPRGTAVLSERPVFEWKPLGPGSTYQVHIYDDQGAPVAESPALEEARWEADRPLPSGVNLQWQVSAIQGEQKITLGKAPETPAKFRIVDAATAKQLQALTRSNPGLLRLAVVYGNAGLIEDARRALRQETATHPGDNQRQRLLDSLSGFGR